ncbi:hypothetical protein Tco_1114209 [Tanacetum coccineum]|uniref:Uncharacterized protein n=1 Tax=Tanacetum coccineum TaxID=301880 RepID=A0ABQ5IUV5_9ASTR
MISSWFSIGNEYLMASPCNELNDSQIIPFPPDDIPLQLRALFQYITKSSSFIVEIHLRAITDIDWARFEVLGSTWTVHMETTPQSIGMLTVFW